MSFAAKYPGKCGECDERFDVGAEVEYSVDDVLVAVHDHGEGELDTTGKQPCPRCFLIHAGECF